MALVELFLFIFETLPINCIVVKRSREIRGIIIIAVDIIDWSFTVKEVGLKLIHVAY
jgi:hypothetical protein